MAFPKLIVLSALGMLIPIAVAAQATQPAPSPIDKSGEMDQPPPPVASPFDRAAEVMRVVQKKSDFRLRDDRNAEVRDTYGVIHIYRVERTDGRRLWLKAEDRGPSGWAAADEVVGVEQAVAFFTVRVRANRNDAFSHLMRGVVRRDQSDLFGTDFEPALSDYCEAIRLDVRNAKAYVHRGSVWSVMQRHDKAVADCTEAIRLDPKCRDAYLTRADALSDKQDYDKAIADYNEGIRLDPYDASAYFNRGFAWSKKEEYDKSIADYTEAIRHDPNIPSAYFNRGLNWAEKGDLDEALADFNRAVRLNPDFLEALDEIAGVRLYQNEYDTAIAACGEVLRVRPGKQAGIRSPLPMLAGKARI